jgi:HEAT repeat protein
MIRRNVIALLAVVATLLSTSPLAAQETGLKRQFDSLFMIASSGEVIYQEMVEPARAALVAMGEDVVPFMIDEFTTQSARERVELIDLLTKIGKPAVPYLVRALNRPEGLVVERVCWTLGDIKDSAAVTPLIGVCGHSRWQVRDQAIGALGRIGHSAAGAAVIAALSDSIGLVRKAAAVSCGQLHLQEAAATLVQMLGDDFYGARMCAMHSLLAMDTNSVVGIVGDSLDSPNHLVGDLGCSVLGSFGVERGIELLYGQTLSDSPGRRAHAAVALLRADPEDLCHYHHQLFQRETDRLVLMKMQSALTASRNEN